MSKANVWFRLCEGVSSIADDSIGSVYRYCRYLVLTGVTGTIGEGKVYKVVPSKHCMTHWIGPLAIVY